jgi:hypothetical protein
MAGGPHAAFVTCLAYGGRAARTGEGIESDGYRCEACGHAFAIGWRRGAPSMPCWPPSPADAALLQALLARRTDR